MIDFSLKSEMSSRVGNVSISGRLISYLPVEVSEVEAARSLVQFCGLLVGLVDQN
jgi:hypothetical protein